MSDSRRHKKPRLRNNVTSFTMTVMGETIFRAKFHEKPIEWGDNLFASPGGLALKANRYTFASLIFPVGIVRWRAAGVRWLD